MYIGYIDPGTGSMLISATIALFSVGYFMLKGVIYRKFNIGGDKGQVLDPNHHYGLVFYSEGKQYWNVFKPLLEETSKRKIEATYMTSDKNDPGLKSNLKGITCVYIGSGKESFFILNRLHADLVVLTTPGLDVLEIKRSKHVKHYSHIVHAPGCIGGYKAYSVDYYDSVMLAGDGDIKVIRELESKRNQKPKKIEVIGQTYLDELRKKVEALEIVTPFFNNERKTVLISPTWSNHGLLMKYGEEIIQTLLDTDNYNIIIRPHPQSFISEKDMLEKLTNKFPEHGNLVWDNSVENIIAMAQADIMISDFSGIIFDYFLLFKRPILTLNEHYEKRGRDVIDLDDEPWDVKMLSVIGKTIIGDEIRNIPDIIETTLNKDFNVTVLDETTMNTLDKYPNQAAIRGLNFIENELSMIIEEKKSLQPKELDSQEKTFTGTILSTEGSWLKNFIIGLRNPIMFFQALLGSTLLTIYFYYGYKIVPFPGLNAVFYKKMLPLMILVTSILLITTAILQKVENKNRMVYITKKEKFEIKDLLLIALPMTPITVYILSNQDILNMYSSVYVFGYFFLFSLLIVILIPWLLSPLLSRNFSIPIGISLSYVTFNMASFGRGTNIKVIAFILAAICVGTFILLYANKKVILITISVLLILTNFMVNIIPGRKNDKISFDPSSKLLSYIEKEKPQKTPDVYILIYDAYANQETLEQYGYDNSAQMQYLLEDNFIIYDGIYSTHATSLSTMSHILNAGLIETSVEKYRENIAGEADGFKAFKKNGYYMQSVQGSDYMTKGVEPKYDNSYPKDSSSIEPHKIIIDAIKEGEFRFDAEFSNIVYDDYIKAKYDVLNTKINKQTFLYTHSNYPGHSQNSGVLLPNETELHLDRLEQANVKMKNDIESIRSLNKEAIIVIAGDHGPYLTKNGVTLEPYDISEINRLDVQDRYGTFLAISWPEKGMKNKYDIQITQDIIPTILSYMYNDDQLFDTVKMERITYDHFITGGVFIRDGIIQGGVDDGKPLFDIRTQRDNND